MRQRASLGRHAVAWAMAVFVGALLAACSRGDPDVAPTVPATAAVIQMTSSAFQNGSAIPRRFTCDGADVSPPLAWTGVPESAQSLALIVDDPDAPGGTWVHWVLFGLSTRTSELPEGASTGALDAIEGESGFGRTGYGGPCPPSGSEHRYFFNLYALDASPSLKPGATKPELVSAMEGRIVALGTLMGTYRR